ncbi:AI-2E family transporter [Halosegnis marinus]|uniref:AI-2E family transporter n=1 Tax=Halosegnis marinus TaxID=3034023 RepID=A0ABD5ZSC4_9EURY|nr:AI-2E family transporter [Halosegnis sp. DT85]
MVSLPDASNARLGWWLVVAGLAVVLAAVLERVVGVAVLGLFVYYVVRPLHRRLDEHVAESAAATATFVGVIVPLVVVVGYIVVVATSELSGFLGGASPAVSDLLAPYLGDEALSATRRETLAAALNDPVAVLRTNAGAAGRAADAAMAVLAAAGRVLFVTFVAGAIAYFLLQDGDRLRAWGRDHLFEDESVLDAFLTAADRDLETVYLGNVFTVALVAVGAAVVYNAYNLLAPPAVAVPIPTALALATGLASFVPVVVGKLVYVPLTGGLALVAARTRPDLVVYPLALFAVALVFLDLLPQAVLRPYLSGRSLHTGATMLSYVLGTTVFGWYGLFLGPLLLVLVVHTARIVLPELLAGEELTPAAAAAALGSEPD